MFKQAKENSVRFYDRLVVKSGSATRLQKHILGNQYNDENVPFSSLGNSKDPVVISPNEKSKMQKRFVREFVPVDHLSKTLHELTKVPDDLDSVQPRPDQIWNCDEVGIDPNGKFSKIIYTYKWCKSTRVWRTQDGEKAPFWCSLLFFMRADGQCFVPPTVVHQGVHQNLEHSFGLPGNWTIHCTPSGYMDRDGWLKSVKTFTHYAKATEGEPLFLFFDGHDSHWDADALDWLSKNHVESFFLQSQNSENDQPNDNGPNACFKACYMNAKEQWRESFGTTQFNVPFMNQVLNKVLRNE